MKSILTVNLTIKENTECSNVEVWTSFINLKLGLLPDRDILLFLTSLLAFQTCWATFKANNNVKSIPTSSALTLV